MDKYLHNIDEEANAMYEILLERYTQKWGITEQLKKLDQVRWVQEMNIIYKCIDELILRFIIG